MEYSDVRMLIRKTLEEWEDDNFSRKDCPNCGYWSLMVKIENDDRTFYRCLACLELFEETLQPASLPKKENDVKKLDNQ